MKSHCSNFTTQCKNLTDYPCRVHTYKTRHPIMKPARFEGSELVFCAPASKRCRQYFALAAAEANDWFLVCPPKATVCWCLILTYISDNGNHLIDPIFFSDLFICILLSFHETCHFFPSPTSLHRTGVYLSILIFMLF